MTWGEPFDAVGLVRLVLDQEGRPRFLDRQPGGGAPQHVFAELPVKIGDSTRGIELQGLVERSPADGRCRARWMRSSTRSRPIT
jgi:hypothetical protein